MPAWTSPVLCGSRTRCLVNRISWNHRGSGMTTVELDSLLANQEFQQLLEAAEHSGSIRHAELAEVLEPHELGLLETEAVYRELDQRGIEVIEEAKEAAPAPPPPPV